MSEITSAKETAQADDRAAPSLFGEFKNVRKVFEVPGGKSVLAIDDVSFDLEQGRLVSLLGPSGCGKTTFLRIVAGLTKASSGFVQVRGEDVVIPHPEFSFMFHTPNLMPWSTVVGNIFSHGDSREERQIGQSPGTRNYRPGWTQWV
jgi:NitT/TauT family transport system ATP-binding protein